MVYPTTEFSVNVNVAKVYLKHPFYILHIVYMVVHVQITSLGLQKAEAPISKSVVLALYKI